MSPINKYLFNFASTYSGGGKQILLSYLEFFNSNGGAHFILNSKLGEDVAERYTGNIIYFVSPSPFQRLYDDGRYLTEIMGNEDFDLFFSYGVPIYKKIAKINWLHISNLIPIAPNHKYSNVYGIIKTSLLRYRLIRFSNNVDALSADSQFALDMSEKKLGLQGKVMRRVLKNGICDEVINRDVRNRRDVAVTVGTQPYKDLRSLYKVFDYLKQNRVVSSLLVIGDTSFVPKEMLKSKDIHLIGVIPHMEVIELLATSKVYISTSMIENSSVASLEGAYLCGECMLSNIDPHMEMLIDLGLEYTKVVINDDIEVLKVNTPIEKSRLLEYDWNNINSDMYAYFKEIV